MTSKNRRLRSTSVSFGVGSIPRPNFDLDPAAGSVNNAPLRRRSSSPRFPPPWRRADSVMERIMNPFLDRESPSHWHRYKPVPALPELQLAPDAAPPAAVGTAARHSQLTAAEKTRPSYKKALAFHDGLHSTYVADYPRGLRGLFVLVQSPLLLIAIGIFAGSVGLAMDVWSVEIARYHQWLGDQGFMLFVLSALLAGGFSAILTQCVCPQAAGSGLPFMKVAISGIDMSAYLSLRCVATKIVGLMAALGAGLSIGKEGPFIMISCGFASVLMNWRPFRRIRDDDTKRLEMLACACAAGVAATFGSPFGGVLFGVEVTSHFYLVRTLPRSFFAAIVGALLVGFGAANTRYGLFGNRSLGISSDTDAVNGSGGPTFVDLSVFATMGIVCGLGGAFFNHTLSILVRARDRFFEPSPLNTPRAGWWKALGKRLGLVLAVTLLSCWLEFYGDSAWFLRHGSPRKILDALFSKDKQVFVADGTPDNVEEDSLLLSRSLVTFLPLKYVLTLISIVLPVPAGLFTPTFVIGGIFGRLVGEAVRAFDLLNTRYEPFEFAIIGAGAFSSGVTHAVSTAVIIMEISHTDGLNLPVSVAILAAYFTAKRFTENVYDVLIVTSNLPRLKKLPKAAYDIPAWEVMKDVAEMGVLTADSTYANALALLKRSDMEPVFPIVDSLENRFLLATVTRSRLAYAVSRCQRQGATPIALTPVNLRQPTNVETMATAATSLLFPTTPRMTTPTAIRTVGYDSGIRHPTPVARAAYGAMDSMPRRDSEEFDDDDDFEDEAEDGLDELPTQLLSSPIHFAFGRGGKVMDWGTNEVCEPTKLTVLIDPSPFQLMEMTPMRRVDMLFRMLKLNNVFVARSGRLMGVISLARMMTFLGTTTPYQAPGLLRTLQNFCSKTWLQSEELVFTVAAATMNMNQMKNASNLHAANATSVVGNSMAIPARLGAAAGAANGASAAQPTAVPMNVSAAQLNQMNLSHVRSAAFKPAVPVTGANVVLPSAGAAAAVPNTAGAGALQLSGRWSLDREDSDSTNDYLEAMGLPLIARQAADKLDLMVIISQTPGDFVITRRTRIFTETKQLKFGQEVNVKNNLITVTGDAAQIKTVTQLSGFRGVLTDVRTLDPRGRMHVELTLTLPEKAPVVINRYFKKTSESTSLENLPAFDISLETSGDVKRKR